MKRPLDTETIDSVTSSWKRFKKQTTTTTVKPVDLHLGSLVRQIADTSKHNVGVVLAICEQDITIYYPAPHVLATESVKSVQIVEHLSTPTTGFIGPFQETLYMTRPQSSREFTPSTLLQLDNLNRLTPKTLVFIRDKCLNHGLVPIMRGILDTTPDAAEFEVTVSFDILVFGTCRTISKSLMNRLQPTEQTNQVTKAIHNLVKFAQIHDKRTWDADTLLKLSERHDDDAEAEEEQEQENQKQQQKEEKEAKEREFGDVVMDQARCELAVDEAPRWNQSALYQTLFSRHGVRLWRNQWHNVRYMLDSEASPTAKHFWFPLPHQCSDVVYYYSPYFDSVMCEQHIPVVSGGIIADESGLGKPATVAAFLSLHTDEWNTAKRKHTLIVALETTLLQWTRELKRVGVPHFLLSNYRSWPGSTTILDSFASSSSSVVIASPAQLQQFSSSMMTGWHRIIVDDAHLICSGLAGRAFRANCWWLLTHSPIQQNLLDLQNMFRVFAIPGFDRDFWQRVNRHLYPQGCGPFQRYASEFVPLFVAFSNLVLRSARLGWCIGSASVSSPTSSPMLGSARLYNNKDTVLIRRNQTSLAIRKILVEFKTRKEQTAYHWSLSNLRLRLSCSQCSRWLQGGLLRAQIEYIRRFCSFRKCAYVQKYAQCICQCQTESWKRLSAREEREIKEQEKQLKDAKEPSTQSARDPCVICCGKPQTPRQTPCGHVFCSCCIRTWLKNHTTCPLCNQDTNPTQLTRPKFKKEKEDDATEKEQEPERQDLPQPSPRVVTRVDSKLKELFRQLRWRERTLILTYYMSTAKQVAEQCRSLKLPCILVGMHSKSEHTSTDRTSVIIMTMEAALFGLLPLATSVDRVFVMEPSLESRMERQIISRLLQIPSSAVPIPVDYLLVKDTIEQDVFDWHWQQYRSTATGKRIPLGTKNATTYLLEKLHTS